MKLLAMLILAQCVAWGQNFQAPYSDVALEESLRVDGFAKAVARFAQRRDTTPLTQNLCPVCGQAVGFTKLHTKTPKSFLADSLIVWLEGYETSTFRVEFDTTTDILNRSPYGRIYKKDESTLSGFMDWLKRRKH